MIQKTTLILKDKWDAKNYPGEGIFENWDGTTTDLVVALGTGNGLFFLPIEAKKFIEAEAAPQARDLKEERQKYQGAKDKAAPQSVGISEETHLKAIALLTGRLSM